MQSLGEGLTLTSYIFRYINMLCVYKGLASFGVDGLGQPPSFSRVSNILFAGIPIVLFLCCGLPLLLGAIGLTAAGAFMVGVKNWIVGGFAVMIGIVALITAIRRRSSTKLACCGVKMDQEEMDCEPTQETGYGDSK